MNLDIGVGPDGILFLKAALVGLSIAAPVGPIGLLCIQRTLSHGPKTGFLSGLGAALADACYGAAGAFGLSAVTHAFLILTVPLTFAGSLFLGWMAFQLLRSSPVTVAARGRETANPWQAMGSVFVLTIANPITILSFVAVFASIAGTASPSTSAAGWMVFGVFIGSAAWWLALAAGVSLLRHRIGSAMLRAINRLAALVLLAFAVWSLVALAVGVIQN